MTAIFQAFPKLGRLNRPCTITEKIDGTNACVVIADDGTVAAQSRTRLIVPGDDNMGFAYWVEQNAERLRDLLGPGHHFGEWWGRGVQRGYNMETRAFSLFNSYRWRDLPPSDDLRTVPVLATHMFSTQVVEDALATLRAQGSAAAPGFMQPEGIVVYHSGGTGTMFKVTLEKDGQPKSQGAP